MTFVEKTVKSEVIYKGKILNLRKDQVIASNGQLSDREIVEHSGGVVMAAVLEDGRMAMVHQYRKAVEEVVFEAPAGKLELGEDLVEAAHRELKEETGFTATNLEFLGSFYSSCGYTNEKLNLFLCTGLIEGEPDPDPTEAFEMELKDLEDLYQMVIRGEIKDGKTALVILLARERLLKRYHNG